MAHKKYATYFQTIFKKFTQHTLKLTVIMNILISILNFLTMLVFSHLDVTKGNGPGKILNQLACLVAKF